MKKNYIQLRIFRGRLDEATKLRAEILRANATEVEALIYSGRILT